MHEASSGLAVPANGSTHRQVSHDGTPDIAPLDLPQPSRIGVPAELVTAGRELYGIALAAAQTVEGVARRHSRVIDAIYAHVDAMTEDDATRMAIADTFVKAAHLNDVLDVLVAASAILNATHESEAGTEGPFPSDLPTELAK